MLATLEVRGDALKKSALLSGLKLTEPSRNTAFSRLTTGLKESPRGSSVLQEHPLGVHKASFHAACRSHPFGSEAHTPQQLPRGVEPMLAV